MAKLVALGKGERRYDRTTFACRGRRRGGGHGCLAACPGVATAADPPFVVVASGLHSPRGLDFGPGGQLYVAQAGDATGANGSIIEIRNAMSMNPKVSTVVSGLATVGDEGEFIGVDGISVRGNGVNAGIYAIMGLSPQAAAEPFGSLLKVSPSGGTETVANVGSYDYTWTGDHSSLWEELPDANPYGVLAVPGHLYVADAGANTLDEVRPDGSVQVLAYFPNTVLRDAIPTCIGQGPDGASTSERSPSSTAWCSAHLRPSTASTRRRRTSTTQRRPRCRLGRPASGRSTAARSGRTAASMHLRCSRTPRRSAIPPPLPTATS